MNSLQIDSNITFDPKTLVVNQPLNIANVSDEELAFKIKTNHKNLVSMYINHGFIKPFSTISIPIKIVQNVDEAQTIKLQINWSKVTPDMKEKNDSKMSTVSKQNIHKKVFSVLKKAETQSSSANKVNSEQKKTSNIQEKRVPNQSIHKQNSQQNRVITPFDYQSKVQTPIKDKVDQAILDEQQMTSSFNPLLSFTQSIHIPGNKNLQPVSQQDQQDHEKQLESLKSQQIQQKRKIDETRSKIRKLTQQIKSKEIIDVKILVLILGVVFIMGNALKALIF